MADDRVNPWLAVSPDTRGTAANPTKGSPATLEVPGAVENVVWQTRAAPPTAAERALAEALRAIFADAVDDLPGIVARLNASGVRPAAGGDWTEAGFVAELARLGGPGAT